jgi:hypothetical protein
MYFAVQACSFHRKYYESGGIIVSLLLQIMVPLIKKIMYVIFACVMTGRKAIH